MSHLANLDLNLLVVLRELIRERNVTRTAARLGVTQPAVSGSLARLRRHFNDELLVRHRNRYVLSPLAVELASQVEAVCSAAERVLAAGEGFDPAFSTREFTVRMADYTGAILGPRLASVLEEQAPNASITLRLGHRSSLRETEEIIRVTDGIIAPRVSLFESKDMRSAELFTDRWICIVDAENEYLGPDGRLDADQIATMHWVVSFEINKGIPVAAPVGRVLLSLGVRPEVRTSVDSYEMVPYWIVGTNRIALMQERLAVRAAATLGLRIVPYPGEPEPIVERFWWHPDLEHDPGHRWFRETLFRVAAEL
jgi:DNA-binding transcriptional LysR family regulator